MIPINQGDQQMRQREISCYQPHRGEMIIAGCEIGISKSSLGDRLHFYFDPNEIPVTKPMNLEVII